MLLYSVQGPSYLVQPAHRLTLNSIAMPWTIPGSYNSVFRPQSEDRPYNKRGLVDRARFLSPGGGYQTFQMMGLK